MVKATNSGGEAQSLADFAVLEPTPERMVEVVKTVVFDDVQVNEGKNVSNKLLFLNILTYKFILSFIIILFFYILKKYKQRSRLISQINPFLHFIP